LITQSSLKNEETSILSSVLLSVGENEDSLFQAARTLKYPLIAQAKIMDAQFELQMAYNPDIMTEFQITALSNHVENVTQQLLKQDNTLLSEVSIAGTWDVQQVAQWHPEPVIVRRCIHDLITEQALRDPMHEALYWTGGNMTYGELEHISTNFAIYLTRLGVKPGTMVPICFEKNPWAIVAMLAILKAGGAYVPLDPAHPVQRRQSFVDEVEAQVIIVSSSTASSCKGMATHIVELSAPLLSSLSDPIREEIRQKPTPSHAAYIIYTSGSTGKPKGAVIQHEALSSAMIGLQRAFGMGQMTRTLQFSNFVFDVSVGDIFATLVGGGTVCVPTAAERLENAPAFMVAARVNTAMLTPSFVRTFTPDQVPCLQTLVTGGEPHGKDTLETWVGRVKYINAYGPTETIVYSTGHEYESPHSPTHNIGIDRHGKSWIVEQNNHHHFTPIGCVGEIVYQGVGLARDYYKNEEKTKEYFIENSPWLPHYDGIRDIFYKTGDLGRFNPDGTMTILGRTDYQVKLRGQRLELGEVEYHITKSDSIQYASTDVLKKPTGDALVAFISFYNKGNKPAEQDDLILPLDGSIKKIVKDVVKDLKAKLPEVMVPTIFLPLREMPMLAGLKIGRKDLRNIANSLTPEQIETYSLVKETKTAPTDPKELVIRELWADVLDMEPEEIDQSDDFLKLGGDHISAVYLVTAAKARGLKLTVDTIFQSPGLASMAAVAEKIESRTASSVQPFSLLRGLNVESVKSAIQHQCKLTAKESIADAYPCTAVQAELFSSANTNSETHFTKMVYKLPSRVGLAQFKHAWEKTIRKCPNLRTRVIQFEGRPIQAIVNNDPHWQANPSEVSGPGVKMGYGIPLCRYALAPDNAGTQDFHLCMHHAIYDVSMIREMFNILQQSYMSRVYTEAR
jgi:amino acid adenylation domain-containing protein